MGVTVRICEGPFWKNKRTERSLVRRRLVAINFTCDPPGLAAEHFPSRPELETGLTSKVCVARETMKMGVERKGQWAGGRLWTILSLKSRGRFGRASYYSFLLIKMKLLAAMPTGKKTKTKLVRMSCRP